MNSLLDLLGLLTLLQLANALLLVVAGLLLGGVGHILGELFADLSKKFMGLRFA